LNEVSVNFADIKEFSILIT